MISLPKDKLKSALKKHIDGLKPLIQNKIEILSFCLPYLDVTCGLEKKVFETEFNKLPQGFQKNVKSLNWFLKKADTNDSNSGKIEKRVDLYLFFEPERRIKTRSNKEAKALIEDVIIYFTPEKIVEILGGLPSELNKELTAFKSRFSNHFDEIKEVSTDLIRFLFDYKRFTEKRNSYDSYQLATNLAAETCLYCNRNYTITVVDQHEKIIRPEWDHYLPKSKYPLLDLSFYNLIPSCHICNSNLKGPTDFQHDEGLHPYLGSFDQYGVKFVYEPLNPQAFNHESFKALQIRLNTDYEVNIDVKPKEQIEKNIDVFKLDNIYNHHVSIVNMLMRLKRLSNSKYLESIRQNIFVGDGEDLPKTDSEVFELLHLSFADPDSFFAHPMSKFKRDMAIELGILKD